MKKFLFALLLAGVVTAAVLCWRRGCCRGDAWQSGDGCGGGGGETTV
jgi:hypothetical protein